MGEEEPTQPTKPKRGKPMQIPVPTRDEIEDALQRMAQPAKPEPSRRRKRRPKQQ